MAAQENDEGEAQFYSNDEYQSFMPPLGPGGQTLHVIVPQHSSSGGNMTAIDHLNVNSNTNTNTNNNGNNGNNMGRSTLNVNNSGTSGNGQ